MNGGGNVTYEYLQIGSLEHRLDNLKDNKNMTSSTSCYQNGCKIPDQRKKEIEEGTNNERLVSTQSTSKEQNISTRISKLEERVAKIEYKTNIAIKVL